MIIYLIKTATCLALLLAFYYIVLEREKMHNFNRFYLLGAIAFSFLSPLYIFYVEVSPTVIYSDTLNPIIYSTENLIAKKTINYSSIFAIIYFIISMLLLLRFGRNLYIIINKVKKNKKIQYKNATLILVDDKILPHTFWIYIFINKKDYENKKIEQELFTHELTHVTQKHTLDIVILELAQAIFWVNPFFILLKKSRYEKMKGHGFKPLRERASPRRLLFPINKISFIEFLQWS